MKRHVTPIGLAVLFIAALFMSSCSGESGLTVQKRHYGKGYYVHRSSGERQEAVAANNETAVASENTTSAKPAENTSAETQQTAAAPVNTNQQQGFASQKAAHKAPKNIANAEQHTAKNPVTKKQTASKPVKSKTTQSSDDDEVMLVLLVILAILLPPLAVFLKEGLTGRFWLDLILALLAFSAFFFTLGGLLYLIAIIIALIAVLKG